MTAIGLMLLVRGGEVAEFHGFLRSDADRWFVVAGTFVVSAFTIWAIGRLPVRRRVN